MDNTTKKILNKIQHSENQTIISNGIDNPFEDIAPAVSVRASLDYLKKHNYRNFCILSHFTSAAILFEKTSFISAR